MLSGYFDAPDADVGFANLNYFFTIAGVRKMTTERNNSLKSQGKFNS